VIQKSTDAPQLAVITGTAAQITCQEGANLVIGGVRILPQQGNGIHHKAGIAETALVGTLIGNKANELRCLLLQSF
jgi:hypothetical protein